MGDVRLWAVKRTTAAKGVEWLKHADNEYREFYWGREPESSLAISDGKEEMERAAGERGGVTCEFVPRSELDEVIRVNGILEEQVDDARSREYAAHEENDRLRNELDEARGRWSRADDDEEATAGGSGLQGQVRLPVHVGTEWGRRSDLAPGDPRPQRTRRRYLGAACVRP